MPIIINILLHFTEYTERIIELKTALTVIGDVSKYVNLGIQLEVSSTKIEDFNQYSPEEQKIKIIQAWFDHDPNPTYKTLYQALLTPSVDDKRAAKRLLLGLSSSMNSSISVDGVHNESSSSVDTTRGMCRHTSIHSIPFHWDTLGLEGVHSSGYSITQNTI